MNKASVVYTIYWENTLIGFRSYLYLPSGTLKYAWRGSRLVILPDYQNLGFGSRILEFLGDYYINKGYKYLDRSSHLRLREHWENSPKWVATSRNNKVSNNRGEGSTVKYGDRDRALGRVAYSYEYMGQDYVDKEHLYIHVDDNSNIDYDIMKQDLEHLKEKFWLCVVTGEINTPSKIEDICMDLGIRTQLLYHTRKGISKIASKYRDKKIITRWDKSFSEQIHKYYKV